ARARRGAGGRRARPTHGRRAACQRRRRGASPSVEYRRAMTRVLALDVGTSSIRAAVCEEDGEPVGDVASRKYQTTDAGELADAVRNAVEEALGGEEVDAVGASTFGHSLLCLDGRGRPASPVYMWRDTRSEDAAEWLRRRLDAEAVHARTGTHLHSSYWPAKLAW